MQIEMEERGKEGGWEGRRGQRSTMLALCVCTQL